MYHPFILPIAPSHMPPSIHLINHPTITHPPILLTTPHLLTESPSDQPSAYICFLSLLFITPPFHPIASSSPCTLSAIHPLSHSPSFSTTHHFNSIRLDIAHPSTLPTSHLHQHTTKHPLYPIDSIQLLTTSTPNHPHTSIRLRIPHLVRRVPMLFLRGTGVVCTAVRSAACFHIDCGH